MRILIAEEDEQGTITQPEGEEQLPEQIPHDLDMTESPIVIDQEDQQVKDEHPQEEAFPGADNVIPEVSEGEEGVHGTIEHITQGHIPSTEKPEEQPEEQAATEKNIISETETTETVEKEFTPSHEHETSPAEIPEEAITSKVPAEAEATKTEVPTTVQEIEGATKAPAVELSEVSSITPALQPEEEAVTTERKPEEHTSTEESVIEKDHTPVIEKEQPTESSVSEETHTEKLEPEETASPHEEFPAQIPEKTETEKPTEEGQVSITEAPERPEISTGDIEKVTSPIAETVEPSVSTISESVTEQAKEGESKVEITPGETETAEIPSESPATMTIAHEISSTEQVATEISHPMETTVTQEAQPTEVSAHPEEPSIQHEQKPVTEEEEIQQPEQATSEHAVIEEEHVTVGAKKESDLTESPAMGEESITTEKQYVDEETTAKIPAQGPTGITPERIPEQKAEDKNVYHVTEDYHDVQHPEISPDNLKTESPQPTSETSPVQKQEDTLATSEETEKPILEQVTEVTVPKQTEGRPEIIETSTSAEETKAESTSAVTEIQASTDSSATTIAHEEHVPEEQPPEKTERPSVPIEIKTEAPSTEDQSTEKASSSEELPTKGLGVEESGEISSEVSGEKVDKEVQPKKEQSSEEETQLPVATQSAEAIPETSSSIPIEHEESTEPLSTEKEHTPKDEHITTAIPSVEQSTYAKDETEIASVEEEKTVTSEKPIEEHVSEQSTVIPGISDEGEKELYEKPVSEEEQTTEAIKAIEEKSTTKAPTIEESKTKQPEQYTTEETPEEVAVTESHGVQEIKTPTTEEGTKEVSTEHTEKPTEATVIEELPKESEKVKPTEITGIEQTELPTSEEHPIESGEIEKEGEEKITLPVSMEETEAPAVETGSKAPTEEQQTEEIHTEPSISEEHLPSQPPIPSDRKEDQEPVEPKPSEEEQEQITQKPHGEKEIPESQEEAQKPTLPSEAEATHVPPSEEAITEGALPEEKPVDTGLIDEAATQPAVEKQPELVSEQPEEVTRKPSGQEEQTQSSIEEQPEMHVRKETEAPSDITPEESSVTPGSTVSEGPIVGEEGTDINKSTEAAISESTAIPVSISEVSTASPELEEHTEHEISTEKETVSESAPSEQEQPEITQPSVIEEKPSQEEGETEIVPEVSTEAAETSEVPVIEEHPHKPEEIPKETITEIPVHEEHEEHSSIAPEEIPEVKVTTEVPLKEVLQYSTEHPTSPEETPVEEETASEIIPRPSGIPGEGNCLVEGQSYNNNSAVPPANVCQISCRCISSIVQCELVECPAPPSHLSNCMPVHTGGESCCPMYACDLTPSIELESDSHMLEHTPEAEEDKKGIASAEIPTETPVEVTEAAKESSTIIGEITPESRPAEVTIPSVSPSEEAEITEAEKQQTTLKPIESVYQQPTTSEQPLEQYPEEHTISPVPATSQESVSQEPEEEHKLPSVPGETTEGKVSEEEKAVTKISTEQPQKEIIPVSGEEIQISTSTHKPTEVESHDGEKETSTVSYKEEITIPTVTEGEEAHVPVEITTIVASKEEETTIKEQEMPTEKIKEESTSKPIEEPEESEKEQQPTASEEPSIVEEHETSTKSQEPVVTEVSVKPEISEGEQEPITPTEHETASIPEIQSTHKPKEEQEISTEGEQTEKSESQTELPSIVSSEVETQKPIISSPESTTFTLHDYTVTELPLNQITIKSVEVSTEESKTEAELEASTKIPRVEEEHVTIPSEGEVSSEGALEQELEKGEQPVKPTDESIPEVSPEETSPETIGSTESTAEITEHIEEHREPSLAEHEEEPSITKLSEPEKPAESEFSGSTEHPVKTVGVEESSETELEKITEPSVAHEPEGTPVSVEEHPEVTPETESHEVVAPEVEHTTVEEKTTSAPQEEIGEQPVTPIIKEPSEAESETPAVEHVTVAIEEQTPKSEEHPVEEQTVSPIPSTGEITEGVVEATPEGVTIQKEQVTEKAIESTKPETELPVTTEEQTVAPEIQKEVEEEQKPEAGITEEAGKEQSVTVPEVTEISKEGTTEQSVKEEVATEEHPSVEEHPEQVVTSVPETTVSIEKKPEEEDQVSEATLPEQPPSEEVTTIASLRPEEHPTVSTETKEEGTEKPQYQTTSLTTEEEVSKPAIEASEVEKPSPEEEYPVTVEAATVKPEEPVTIVSVEINPTEKPAEVLPETERPTISEQETELSEQGETTTKAIESVITEEQVPEKTIPMEVTPEAEGKPSEAPEGGQQEETHPTVSGETTSIHEEEEPSIIKLQPTEESLPSEGETSAPGEIQPSQLEEGQAEHPGVSEEGHPVTGLPEEPQFTTEHVAEVPVTIQEEEHPETEQPEISPVPEGPIKVSGVPTVLPEEQITIGPVPSEESIPESSIRPEEGQQMTEVPVEQHVIKTEPELPGAETTEKIPEEEVVHPQKGEEIGHPHIDHFPEVTIKPEPDYSAEGELTLGSDEEHLRPVNHSEEVTKRPSFHEQQPVTTLAPHIPEYPDHVSGEDNPHFPVQGGSYLNHDEDYDEDDQIYGPGTCRYGGKVYVSAQQIPRDDPCDFCFCFRSDIICLQQSCPPPIPGCHEEPISGFCCPRYECPVSMATALNLTTTTTTTTTTLPPHFHAHAYKGAARRNGCQINGKAYRVGEVIKSASGPCLHCT